VGIGGSTRTTAVTGSPVSLTAFLVGAVGAGRLEIAMRPRPRHQWIRTAFIGEALLQAVATIIAFAGTVRKLAVQDMTTVAGLVRLSDGLLDAAARGKMVLVTGSSYGIVT
jgi:hypothetical protein